MMNEEFQSIHQAAQNGKETDIIAFISKGISINQTSCDLSTPLHFSVFSQNEETFRFLLSKGAKVNAKNKKGLTPLHIAVDKANEYFVISLLEAGANPNEKDISACIRAIFCFIWYKY